MKQSYRFAVIGSALLSFSLTGCGLDPHPAYSEGVKYGVRTDPILKENPKELGDERDDVDRPNTLPIVDLKDALKPEHPYHGKREKLDDKIFRDPTKLSSADRQELETQLEAVFGTPRAPKIDAKEAGIDSKTMKTLDVDDKTLAMGSTRYRIHCLHCHGVPGDGRGPTARWINPHPRDFRLGIFKFQSVDQTTSAGLLRPARADLIRTVRYGLEGTAMPNFNLLENFEIESIVSYVIHLAIRGQVEVELIKAFQFKDGNLTFPKGDPIKKQVRDYAKLFTEEWADSQDPKLAIKVGDFPFDPKDLDKLKVSALRGQQFFTAKPSDALKKEYMEKLFKTEAFAKRRDNNFAAEKAKAETDGKKLDQKDADALMEKVKGEIVQSKLTGVNCVSCHVDYGRQARYRFDEWGNLARPNNLATGILRGGKRPVDIYYRVHSGIRGSGMSSFGRADVLTGDEIWDIVNFVSNLPYPHMRERLGITID